MSLEFIWTWISVWLIASIYGSGLKVLPSLGWSKPRLSWLSNIFITVTEYQFNLISGVMNKSHPQVSTFEDFAKSKWYYNLCVDATSTEEYSFDEKLQRYFWCMNTVGGVIAACTLGVFFSV